MEHEKQKKKEPGVPFKSRYNDLKMMFQIIVFMCHSFMREQGTCLL